MYAITAVFGIVIWQLRGFDFLTKNTCYVYDYIFRFRSVCSFIRSDIFIMAKQEAKAVAANYFFRAILRID